MLDALYYWTGVVVVYALIGAVLLIPLTLLYIHLSIGFTYVYHITKAQTLHPSEPIVADEFKGKRFWRLRLYFHVMFSPKISFGLLGTKRSCQWYSIDCMGWVPRGRAYKSNPYFTS
ncbi:MAG: hypothetical protein GY833_12405 [Aestuariibacter sp.]|nr:hypothetical protein [Aestuariibacter sp.]